MKKFLNASPYAVELESGPVPIVVRKHPRSRRIVIRYQPLRHVVSLTLPRYASLRQGLRFIEEKRGWLEAAVKAQKRGTPFEDGAVIPFLGKDYRLRHAGGRGVARLEGDEILVPGDKAFFARRLTDWLKDVAHREITRLAQEKALIVGKTITKITVRDTVSHWGSCARGGRLSFSWRLAFAPLEVLEYVVCHEIAHLVHHNHGPAFWRTVADLYPDHLAARRWLKAHGASLYRYGR